MPKVVFYMHRVYPDRKKGKTDDLKLKDFIRAIKLIRRKFKIVKLHDLISTDGDKNLAALTFDDGYADDFVYAYPILKSMNVPAHVFLNSKRVIDGIKRKNLFDYWEGKVSESELFIPKSMYQGHLGFVKNGRSEEFLSWSELDTMRDVFSFGSHGETHFSYPYKDKVINFFDGENFHWNMLLYCKEPFIGLPKFPTRSVLDTRKFNPSRELLSVCKNFPKKGNWKENLGKAIEGIGLGTFEGKKEAEDRIRNNLESSKLTIEDRLNVRVDTFSWPFGHFSDWSENLASKVYDFIFTTKKGFIEGGSFQRLPRVSVGKDIFTVLGRTTLFSSRAGFKLYKFFKEEKTI